VSSPVHDDPLMRALGALPEVVPDQTRSERVRTRCRARLERGGERSIPVIEPATVGTVCALYAWQVLRLVLR
jgi:hypothetical protein